MTDHNEFKFSLGERACVVGGMPVVVLEQHLIRGRDGVRKAYLVATPDADEAIVSELALEREEGDGCDE